MRRLLVLLVLALVGAGCTRRGAEGLPPGVAVEDLPDSESWEVRLRTSADGRAEVEVEAPYLARYTRDSAYVYLGPPPGQGSARAVEIRLFDDAGALRGSVRAREVWLFDDASRVVAEGQARATLSGDDGAVIDAARIEVDGEDVTATGGVSAEVFAGGGARVRAPRLRIGPGGAFTASGGATADLAGAAQATVSARTLSGDAGGTEASGGVRVLASGGRTLQAGRVVWREAAARFSAPGAFTFDGPGERVQGVGLSASADLSRYSFRRATGQIEVRE